MDVDGASFIHRETDSIEAGYRGLMKHLAQPYRMFSIALLTAFGWAISLPVVHLVCAAAMSPQMEMAHHGHGGQPNHDEAGGCPSEQDMSCCILQSQAAEGSVSPASLVKTIQMNVAVSHATGVTPLDRIPPAPAIPRGAPPLPHASHLFFSVLLI